MLYILQCQCLNVIDDVTVNSTDYNQRACLGNCRLALIKLSSGTDSFLCSVLCVTLYPQNWKKKEPNYINILFKVEICIHHILQTGLGIGRCKWAAVLMLSCLYENKHTQKNHIKKISANVSSCLVNVE